MESLRAYLPSNLFEKVERIDAELQALEDALPFVPASERKLPAFHINSPMESYCGACDVDNLEGPGLTSCQNAASCDLDAFTPPPGQAGLMSGVDFENFEYPEHFVVVANMDVGLPVEPAVLSEGEGQHDRATGALPAPTFPRAVNATTLELALLAALGQIKGDPLDDALGPDAFYLTVFSAEADDFFAGLAPGLAESAQAAHYASWTRKEMDEGEGEGRRRRTKEKAMTADDASVRRFKVVFVSPSRNKTDAILAWLQGAPLEAEREYSEAAGTDRRRRQAQEDDSAALASIDVAASVRAYLKSAFAADRQDGQEELEPDVTMWNEQSLYVPGYHSEALLNHVPVTGVGADSILLSDPSRPSAPLHHLQYKTAYDVILEQFWPNSLINILVVGAAVAGEDGARPPYLLATVTTDANGGARIQRRFRALALPPGDYYFKALDMTSGAEGLSPVYSLSDAPQRRRLYGPVMWV